MISGVLIFITGGLLYISSKKPAIQPQNTIEKEKPPEVEITQPVIVEIDNELENAIEIAIADGVLTKNEKTIIRKITDKKGLDFNEVIKKVEQQIAESDTESETEVINYNKKQGDDFEKFVVQKFNRKYYKVKEWAGDKYVKGVYAETTQQPDILFEKNVKEGISEFWVECKWKQASKSSGVQFCSEEQFNRYKVYEKVKNIPVFIALGTGGKGISPKNFYVVPLRFLDSNFIPMETLTNCEKEMNHNLYYDLERGYINSLTQN